MGWKVKEIKDNIVNKELLKVLFNKNVLFLENDNSLTDAVGNFEIWLRHNKIQYNGLFSINDLAKLEGGFEYIKQQIDWYDVIAFQTTWTYEVSRVIEKYLRALKNKKIIIECYIYEPSWFYKPKGIRHDMYALASNDEKMDEWEFKKLRLKKAVWED